MKKLTKHVSAKQTSQHRPIPGRERDMTRNYAGAFTFKADIWTQLNRFLTIGSAGGTYYASEKQVTLDNFQALQECVAKDGLRVIRETVEISAQGRAPKNDQAILVLAYCLKKGDLATRQAAEQAVNKVCRIGTHIFQLAEAIEAFGGWGMITTRAVANWYNSRAPEWVAFQAVKYQQRDGWSHKDLIKLSHVLRNSDNKSLTSTSARVYGWIVDRNARNEFSEDKPRILEGFERIQGEQDAKQAAGLIRDYRLPREVVPTELLNCEVVWEALLEDMPMTAMIRNLGKMSNVGLLDPMSEWTAHVVNRLSDHERLRKARVHPINVLVALKTYSQGHGVRGSLKWDVNQQIVNALDDAFYGAFDNIEPINKRVLVAIDKSGSMLSSASATILSAQECAAVMAMVTVKKASQYYVVGYDSNYYGSRRDGVRELAIDPRQRLDDVLNQLPYDGGGTDASLPIKWAGDRRIVFDAICLYSDGESWAGHTHASQAMDAYRKSTGLKVLFCTCDTVANQTQLGDNLDELAFHVAGFDEQAPVLIQNFINGQ
jgi:60 kDa SS-A/Ro ribonucleoprotein